MLEVNVQGIKEVEALINNLATDIKENTKFHKELSTSLSQKASSMAPRLTGALASSVVGTAEPNKAKISAGSAAVPYAGVIEYGWPNRNIQAQPYLAPAVYNNLGYIVEQYNKNVEDKIKQYNLQ